MKELITKRKGVLMELLIVLAICFGLDMLRSTDSTDKSRFKRSGMNLYIDHGTGCHYLSGGGFFGKEKLIPRLDKDGKQVCEGDKLE